MKGDQRDMNILKPNIIKLERKKGLGVHEGRDRGGDTEQGRS